MFGILYLISDTEIYEMTVPILGGRPKKSNRIRKIQFNVKLSPRWVEFLADHKGRGSPMVEYALEEVYQMKNLDAEA